MNLPRHELAGDSNFPLMKEVAELERDGGTKCNISGLRRVT